MNVFEYLQKERIDRQLIRWIKKELVLNPHTEEFHFTENQEAILKEYHEKERYYKMSRGSGKTTLIEATCLYHAETVPNSLHIIFLSKGFAANFFKEDMLTLLKASGKESHIAKNCASNSLKYIRLNNGSTIYFATSSVTEKIGGIIDMRNSTQLFVYCDDLSNVEQQLFFARMHDANFLAFSTL